MVLPTRSSALTSRFFSGFTFVAEIFKRALFHVRRDGFVVSRSPRLVACRGCDRGNKGVEFWEESRVMTCWSDGTISLSYSLSHTWQLQLHRSWFHYLLLFSPALKRYHAIFRLSAQVFVASRRLSDLDCAAPRIRKWSDQASHEIKALLKVSGTNTSGFVKRKHEVHWTERAATIMSASLFRLIKSPRPWSPGLLQKCLSSFTAFSHSFLVTGPQKLGYFGGKPICNQSLTMAVRIPRGNESNFFAPAFLSWSYLLRTDISVYIFITLVVFVASSRESRKGFWIMAQAASSFCKPKVWCKFLHDITR